MVENEPVDQPWLWDEDPKHWLICAYCGEWCAYSQDGVWRDRQDCLCECGDMLRITQKGEIVPVGRKKP